MRSIFSKNKNTMKKHILIALYSIMIWGGEREPNVPIEFYKSYAWNKLEVSSASHHFYNSAELNQLIIREIDKNMAKKGI
jgi:hypothetical protein